MVIGLLVASLLLNAAMAFRPGNHTHLTNIEADEFLAQQTRKYPLLSSRILIDSQRDFLINFTPLRESFDAYTADHSYDLGLYFEYLPTGSSVGHNSDKEMKLASLSKVPVVMAVYNEMEQGKIKPGQMIAIRQEHLSDEFGSLYKRGAGSTVSLEEAVSLALRESDNTAANALASLLQGNAFEDVFDQFDLPKKVVDTYPVLTPKSYSSMLRSLYLSTYINKEHSSHVLSELAKSVFADKLPAGVDKNITVAHKIGVLDDRNGPINTFSDCGIIYVPNRPYLLCIVMTGDEELANKAMSELSRIAYDYVRKADYRQLP